MECVVVNSQREDGCVDVQRVADGKRARIPVERVRPTGSSAEQPVMSSEALPTQDARTAAPLSICWNLRSVRCLLLGTADPGSPLHRIDQLQGIKALVLDALLRALEFRVFESSSQKSVGYMPTICRFDDQARLGLLDGCCILVSRRSMMESGKTASALESKSLKWDVLRGTYQLHGAVAECRWMVHVQKTLTVQNEWDPAGMYDQIEEHSHTEWEPMASVASIKWDRIPVGSDEWHEWEFTAGRELLLVPLKGCDSDVSLEDSDDESSEDNDDEDEYFRFIKEYEQYMMRWELLGIDMHGLDAVEDYEHRWMPLALQDQDELNSLFGFGI